MRLALSSFLLLTCLAGCAHDTEEVLGSVSEAVTGTARGIAQQGPNSDELHGADPTPQ
jgi:hypothetical protein